MKRFWIFAVLPWLTHCSYQDAAQEPTLPYAVDPVVFDGPVTESPVGAATSLLLKQNLTLRICLRDRWTLAAVPAVAFAVGEPAREVTPDHGGCLRYPLEISYRPHAAEVFLPYSLPIRALDGTDQSFTLSFWVNPWSRQVSDMVNGGKPAGAVEVDAAEEARLGTGRYAPALWFPDNAQSLFSNVQSDTLEIVPGLPRGSAAKTEMPLSVKFRLSVRAKRLDGTFRKLPLSRQSFTVRLALVDRTTRRLLGSLETDTLLEVTAGEGQLNLAPFALSRIPEPGNDLAWQLRLEPRDPSAALLPWEGELPVSSSDFSKPIRNAALDLPLGGWERLSAPAAEPPGTAARPHGFFLDRWKVQYARDLRLAPEGYVATAGSTVEVCLFDAVTTEPLKQQRVRVELSETPAISGEAELAVADAVGCVRPGKSFPVSYPYFSLESYLKRYLVVRAESGPHAGLVQAVEVAVNPWQKDDDLFFWDTRRGPAPQLADQRRANLQIQDFNFQYPPQKDDLEIDTNLNLTYKEAFFIALQPSINRPAAFDKQRGPTRSTETLWPGMKFRVRLAFAGTRLPDVLNTDRLSHLRLLSGFETTVVADDRGILNVPVALAYDFNERPLLETQTRVFLEISADGTDGPEPVVFESPFDLLADTVHGSHLTVLRERFDDILAELLPKELATRDLTLTPAKLSALMLQPADYRLWKPTPRATEKPFDLFLKLVGQPSDLKQITVGSGATPWPTELAGAFTASDFDRLTSLDKAQSSAAGPQVLRRLCSVYFNPAPSGLRRGETSLYSRCLARPDYYLRLHRFRFVESNPSSPTRMPADLTTIQMQASFFREQSDGETDHKGHGSSHNLDVGVTAKVGYETFGNGVTAHASYLYKNSWFTTRERTASSANRNRLLVQEMRTLVAEETRLEADADLKDCVFFRHRPWMPTQELTAAGRAERGYFFCRTSRRRISESWYYLTDATPNASLGRRNARDLRNRIWLVLLRGRDELTRFKETVENRNLQVDIKAAPIFRNGIDHLLNDVYQEWRRPYGLAGSGGAFPGLIEHAAW